MAKEFDSRVALVTGAGSGIGKACAQSFSRKGAKVVIVDVSTRSGQETMLAIQKSGGTATFINCDVSESDDVRRLVDRIMETYGRLDFACNNAGIEGVQAPITDYPEDVWNRVIGINLIGVWLCMKYELPHMLRQGSGIIVNLASILGTVGFPNASAHVAAKHGIIGLTKAVAIEYATKGIRVNAVCPGFIYTPMLERAGMREGSEQYRMIANLHPVHRMGKSEEVAETVTWLCSDAASFITGHSMLADGGYVAQ